MSKGTLIDTTKCVGCRSCQVTCKEWNGLPAEKTSLEGNLGLQNPKAASAKTFVVITYNEIADKAAPGGLKYVFTKRQCMHCNEPACAAACPTTAMHKTKLGPVVYDDGKCIGCRYCMNACPFNVPTAEWDSLAPKIRKCTMCYDRVSEPVADERNGQKLTSDDKTRLGAAQSVPACVKQCTSGALKFGERDELLVEARRRIKMTPAKYVDYIYGEREAGGTGMLYLASVPFEQLGFPNVGTAPYTHEAAVALESVSPVAIGLGVLLGGSYALQKRKSEVALAEASPATASHAPAHIEFAPVKKELWTTSNIIMAVLVALGAICWIARLVFGLGGSTNLSDTRPWGLWIFFDLVWIALAAGAFGTAGLIYVFRRKDLYSLGRSAVLMGLLSYTFVTGILVADLGLPWHAWQIALQRPLHSAMFEVSWCIGLYVTILAFEFLPVPLQFLRIKGGLELWRKYSPAYVVGAVTLFVYLMSHSVIWAAVACAVFAVMAYAFRPRPGEEPVPIMLAIAAVVLSTMHQSSLGSVFLLMRDKLSAGWWSPILPIEFFVSALAAGLALVILTEVWMARSYGRQVRVSQLAFLGRIVFAVLLAYDILRVADIALRGNFALIAGEQRGLLALEMLTFVVPLAIFATAKLRRNAVLLACGALLTTFAVLLNRANVVLFAWSARGPIPQVVPPTAYIPSLVEFGIAFSSVAATILLFEIAVRSLPIRPVEETAQL